MYASVLSACQVQRKEISSITEARRNPFCRQGCTPMKAAHPFRCTPVQLHTHKDAHSFSCTPVAKVHMLLSEHHQIDCIRLSIGISRSSFFGKREKAKAFSFSIKRSLYRFSCSIQYLSSVVKSNITGVYISTLS